LHPFHSFVHSFWRRSSVHPLSIVRSFSPVIRNARHYRRSSSCLVVSFSRIGHSYAAKSRPGSNALNCLTTTCLGVLAPNTIQSFAGRPQTACTQCPLLGGRQPASNSKKLLYAGVGYCAIIGISWFALNKWFFDSSADGGGLAVAVLALSGN
jgi:hypothetical protein